MPDRNAAPVNVDDLVREPELCLGPGDNRAEGLIDLNEIEI